jgi:hypothetical protein
MQIEITVQRRKGLQTLLTGFAWTESFVSVMREVEDQDDVHRSFALSRQAALLPTSAVPARQLQNKFPWRVNLLSPPACASFPVHL